MNDRLDSCRSEELELYAFDFLEGAERAAVEAHVERCAECRAELADRLGTRDLVELELRRTAPPETTRVVVSPPVLVARPSSNGRAHAPARGRRVLLPVLAAAAVLLVCALVVLKATRPAPVAPADGWTEVGEGIRINGDQRTVRVRAARRLEIDEGRLVVEVDAGDEPVRVATPTAVVACDEGRFELYTSPGGTSVRVDRGAVRFERFDSPPRIVSGRDGRIIFVIRDAAILGENERLKEENARLLAEIERLGGTAPIDDEPLKSAEEEVDRFDWSELAWALEKIEPLLRRGEMPRDPKALARYSAMLRTLGRVARARTGSKLLGAIVRREWPAIAPADVAAVEDAARDALETHKAEATTATTPTEVAAADERLEAKLNESLERVREQYGEPVSELTIREDAVRDPPPSNDTGSGSTGSDAGGSASGGDESDPVSITPTKPATSVLDSSGFATSSDRYRVHTGTATDVERAVLIDWRSDLGLSTREASALEPIARTIAQRWVEASVTRLNAASSPVVAGLKASLGLGPKPRDVAASEVNRLRLALLELQQRAEKELAPELSAAARKKLESGATRPTILLPAR